MAYLCDKIHPPDVSYIKLCCNVQIYFILQGFSIMIHKQQICTHTIRLRLNILSINHQPSMSSIKCLIIQAIYDQIPFPELRVVDFSHDWCFYIATIVINFILILERLEVCLGRTSLMSVLTAVTLFQGQPSYHLIFLL